MSELIIKEPYESPNVGPISQVLIKVLNDFENTFLASRNETSLVLSLEELKDLKKAEEFQEKLEEVIFQKYLKAVIKNSFDTLSKLKSNIDSEQEELLKLYCLFLGKSISVLGYSFYPCIDEDTNDVVSILTKNGS